MQIRYDFTGMTKKPWMKLGTQFPQDFRPPVRACLQRIAKPLDAVPFEKIYICCYIKLF